MNKLNVFNQFYSPWKYPSNWIKNFKFFFRQFKWAYQRITRGYCDPDWWDLDDYYLNLFVATLNHMADNTIGWPSNEEFPEFEDWQNYLREMANDFFRANESNDYYPHPAQDAWWEDIKDEENILKSNSSKSDAMIKENMDIDMKRRKDMEQGLDKMKHIFFHLWD